MLSIYDVVWEKANFKGPLRNLMSKFETDQLTKSIYEMKAPLFYGELCLRVALRMIHLYDGKLDIAYGDLLYNASQIDDIEKAEQIVEEININNEPDSIRALLRLTALYAEYDHGYYTDGILHPEISKIPDECIEYTSFIISQINRFEQKYDRVPERECQFDGAYNEVISKGYTGMPVYIIENTLWVFNIHNSTKWGVVLLLIAYVMGMHSEIHTYENIERLGIFDFRNNYTEMIDIKLISNMTFSAICKNYIGYETPKETEKWRLACGTNKERKENAIQYHKNHLAEVECKELIPEAYNDGIYDVTYLEYGMYYKREVDKSAHIPVKPGYIDKCYLLKSEKYIMFVAKGNNKLYLLQGGKCIKLENSDIDYYHRNLKIYGDKIRNMFSDYWNLLEKIAVFVKELGIPDIFAQSGKIHGCIVDINYHNHIYVNIDGKVTPYYAEGISNRKPYTNLVSLLEEQIPESIERFYELCDSNKYVISSSLDVKGHLGVLTNEEINLCNEIDSEQEIYDMSRLMKRFQTVHDANLICIWSDKLLNKSDNVIESH